MQADDEADALEQEARLKKQAAATKEAPPADEEEKPWFFRGHDTVGLNMLTHYSALAVLTTCYAHYAHCSLCSPLITLTLLTKFVAGQARRTAIL